ncbi:MAG: hypothetical protein ACKO7C_07470 [Bacteroidota bacterium]
MKILFLCFFTLSFGMILSQDICLESRQKDDAIIKELYYRNGAYYITVDIVQIDVSEDGEIEVKNENPKLRTFIIDSEIAWQLCLSKIETLKIKEIAKRPDLILNTYFQFSAEKGKIVYSIHHSCSG